MPTIRRTGREIRQAAATVEHAKIFLSSTGGTNMLKQAIRLAAAAALSLAASGASAVVTCRETVTEIIPHTNGGVFFKTDLTCTNYWCQLNWSSTTAINRALATMLAAQAQGKHLYITWQNLTACTAGANPVYASPDALDLAIGD
jgi:hypothetical protein